MNYPLKEGLHFQASKDGVAGLFETIYFNTKVRRNVYSSMNTILSNYISKEFVKVYAASEENLNASVLPILRRLLKEIKSKAKQLKVDKSKGENLVKKARLATEQHIILLAKTTRSYDASTGKKIEQPYDPYLVRQGVDIRLVDQAMKEKVDRQENEEIQKSFLWFEMHILQSVQSVLAKLFQFMGSQFDHQHAMYGDILGTAQLIHPDLEWFSFVERKNAALRNSEALRRSSVYSTFPNKDHRATKPIMEGDLVYQPRGIPKLGHCVVTRAGYLHYFDSKDDPTQQSIPEISLYLADCSINSVDNANFRVQGVNVSKRNLVNPFHTTTQHIFRAQSFDEAEKWLSAIDTAIRELPSSLSSLYEPTGIGAT